MLARLGFVAAVLSENLSTSRTCRLRNATGERLQGLTSENLDALDRVISFLERHRIRLYRITSNLIPFASHPINTGRWYEENRTALACLGSRLRTLGIRVSTHPGQYTVLNSANAPVVRAAIAELKYHATLLDSLGMDRSCRIVLHVGGLYGGGERPAMRRFATVVRSLPPAITRRLVVENDDRLFDAEEVLEVGRTAGIPVVFDWLHHRANPCRAPVQRVVAEIFRTWRTFDGRPKIHMSSQAAHGPPGAHADFVRAADLLAFMAIAPDEPFDCMLEAKKKDRALLRLRDELCALGILESDLEEAGRSRAGAPQLQSRTGSRSRSRR